MLQLPSWGHEAPEAQLSTAASQTGAVTVCLVWGSPETKPTAGTWVQFIYLEGDPKKVGGSREGETGKTEKALKGE